MVFPEARLAVALLCALAAAASARAQDTEIRRCVTADGQVIYTDRACAEFTAVERAAPDPVSASGPASGTPSRATPENWSRDAEGFSRRGCSRTAKDLLSELRAALEAHDVNRLAGIYQWTGMSSGGAAATMTRLDALSKRPLVSLALQVQSAGPAAPRSTGSSVRIGGGGARETSTIRGRPSSVRIDQVSARDEAHVTTTHLRLERSAGCWWLRF